ncbi:Nucleotidyltransferase [Polychaeton citri CBS 116435]|uniref:DNA polymerase n=1 Tax=Polychaeton citri CBS 116435 TaxID=1314669 RepID=A0A9P4QD27_9PEZI|nr:Nucleotidyltransferase [Polychaeton citri CBS 116435]
MPAIFVSATHVDQDELFEIEDDVTHHGGNLTYDLSEALIVISKVKKKARIQLDLRAKGLWTEELQGPDSSLATGVDAVIGKRKREGSGLRSEDAILLDDDSDASHDTMRLARRVQASSVRASHLPTPAASCLTEDVVNVITFDWFYASKEAACPLPLKDYVTFKGKRIGRPNAETHDKPTPTPTQEPTRDTILSRAKEDAKSQLPTQDRFQSRKFGRRHTTAATSSNRSAHNHDTSQPQYAHLLRTMTSEYDSGASSDIPPAPAWVQQGVKYACQRRTPAASPNTGLLDQLKRIRLARELTADQIGVRAYSTSIAAIAAYPYKLMHPREVLRLPGCDAKIANLFVEFANTGSTQAVRDIAADPELAVLELFHNIWGVGATTARDFYFQRGWRELDDIIEFGWPTLSRVQQIGVKFYHEFLDRIPRTEVAAIAATVHDHACRVRDTRIQSLLVGGYRRGKPACGDVDIIVSHPDERQTLGLVHDIVASLEGEEWITHTLLLSLHNTHRDQQTLPFRAGHAAAGAGFDTLDKALVVWQDPSWPSRDSDVAASAKTGAKVRNPNVHRRVDIIIAPWRAVGCAVAGWSGGTTFQRDLRRYAKNVKGWKFDSSGVRSRRDGEVVDLEGWAKGEGCRATTMEEAEERVFQGMGLEFVPPEQRCTG